MCNFSHIAYTKNKVKQNNNISSNLTLNDDFVSWEWLNGISNNSEVDKQGELYNLHHLVVEDIKNFEHLPKIEDHYDYLYLSLKHIKYDKHLQQVNTEAVSLILFRNTVLSFSQSNVEPFDSIVNRITQNKGRIRHKKADYLFYCLIDSIVDNYFSVIEQIRQAIEDLEDNLIEHPEEDKINTIHQAKKLIHAVRKLLNPLLRSINYIKNEDNELINDETLAYFNDIKDHLEHQLQNLEDFRDMTAGLIDLNMVNISNRMNSVMKTLTVIATIFIPLTFVAGIYGMNFEYMPELHWPWGYPVLIIVMLVITLTMIMYMKSKKWL